VGAPAEFAGHMLEVTLGPGMLSRNYDGLQNDLDKMEGIFIQRGNYTFPLNKTQLWNFKPIAKMGDSVVAGSWIGEVDENSQPHKIMVPFTFEGQYTLKSVVPEGKYTIEDKIAVLTDSLGNDIEINMMQRWPVRKAITTYSAKLRPFKLIETGIRVIDSANPIVEGGTGFIPGAFGTGKTILQHAISKQVEVDIVIVAACGERANEVVEIFMEFPKLVDPHTGRKLMERTIIIANTSNMPVAAREASVYTAMTIAEYYRSMGLKVLLMADSTSRWAQALREMSNRLEELPGPDAFPMDLSAIISNFYGRAGYVELNNGETGSITFIGTVSPAGGNLKEPVTENTKKVARCFLALEQERADKKRYPAINPIDSYSKYLEYPEFAEYIGKLLTPGWIITVNELKARMQRGKEVAEQINILGDDGVPISYHVIFWKSELIDFAFLQQDAFDKVDAVTPIKRQKYMVDLMMDICHAEFEFATFTEVMDYFKKMINICKQMNYSLFQSEEFKRFEKELEIMIQEKKV
jgi:V/A-type H+-transporting ATPase subunit A